MKIQRCIQEPTISAAAHVGAVTAEQQLHAQTCPICESVLLVAAATKNEVDQLVHLRPLDASVIWHRAQHRARKQALARATLPIRIALAASCVIAIFSVPWVISGFSMPRFVSVLSRVTPQFASLKWLDAWHQNWDAMLSGTTAIGITATLICIALSSWFVAREQ